MILGCKLSKHREVVGLYFVFLVIFSVVNSIPVFADYTISMTTSGSQTIDVFPETTDGVGTSISHDDITVNTTCRSGYNLTVGTSVNNNNLYLNGSSSNNQSGKYFSPANGSSKLFNSPNTWGYYYSPNTTPTRNSVFSAVPALGSGNATIISELSTPSQSNISDSLSVYYGVSVSSSITPGTYKMIPDTNNSNNDGVIIYYLTLASSCIPYTLNFSPTSTSTGSSISGTGTMASQEYYKDTPANLPTMSFTPPSGYEFKEWNTAEDGTGTSYSDAEEITNIANPGDNITLYAIWYQPHYLYNEVANLNRGTLAENNIGLTDVITTPTSTDKNEDTSNSGVFTYDPSVYGTASDASNDYPIYFYRGILETNPGSIGALGSANAYPNYVKLDNNTCWRILRTTGSGGVKMIYSGLYGATTSGSCANDGSKLNSATNRIINSISVNNIHAVGYTYNNDMTGVGTITSVDTIFGNDSNPSLNNTRSDIKIYIEDTWYANNMTNYTDILEPSAGYCNDRTIYSDRSLNPTAITSILPYDSRNSNYAGTAYFGAYERNSVAGATPSLTCPRNVVDLYRYVENSSGLGNELKYPAALMTADEQSFAGNGNDEDYASTYSTNSFLSSTYTYGRTSGNGGDPNLSPANYFTGVSMMQAIMGDQDHERYNGGMTNVRTDRAVGVRPAISLIHQIYVASGSGTATDPWTITTEDPDEKHPINLYNAVADMSQGTQTAANLQETITTNNSGVYEYNSSVFGTDTDGTKEDNTKATIYYYRGILDNTTGTYGSDGDGEVWSNYVVLASSADELTSSDTCWRIIRTTGSGGVKMIYNGTWTGTTCANATTSAQVTTTNFNTFNGRYAVSAGYTYNSSYSSGTSTTNTAISTLFGSDSNYNSNSSSSNAKNYLENTWFNNISSFQSILEGNAGYCNDRTLYNTSNTQLAETTTIRRYYTRNSSEYRFGAYIRNSTTSKTPSLACPRSIADLYTTSSASSGNGQLAKPVGLLTADEASFAGSGSTIPSQGSNYNTKSFLNSGSNYLLMSPNYRNTSNYVHIYYLSNGGSLAGVYANTTGYGIRPVVSLIEGTEAVSGTGTATDPWVVEAP